MPPKKKTTPKKKPAPKPATVSIALPDPPSQATLNSLSQYPAQSADDIAHLLRPPADFTEAAQQVLAVWQPIASQFNVPGLTVDMLVQALATYNEVAPIEQAIEPFYQRARTTRLKAGSDALNVLYTLARAVKGVGDTGLMQRFSVLFAWIAKHHAPKNPAKKKTTTKTT
jgi:hypothetical protein